MRLPEGADALFENLQVEGHDVFLADKAHLLPRSDREKRCQINESCQLLEAFRELVSLFKHALLEESHYASFLLSRFGGSWLMSSSSRATWMHCR